ncbi:serpentine type 7TM GPCR chemoreceptor srt domain-containing protein [Ditylenchus destructor]|uniref:Serpentine type 7TM GPCR chemoreceptor srt domain-containing protein n=1 Tax=Ditylenchus destructor TaxID=166010 RepID=A0AAD4MIT0_9BILA|nr:serpentine type 7TM GPCR chemoreceptor srt domain-containing protein [Ditylenchus destructor]
MITSAIYVFMQFGPISEALIILAEFGWLLAHGMPPLIYLTMNRTIRKEAYQLCLRILHRKDAVSTVSSQSLHSVANAESSLQISRIDRGVIIQNSS